MQYLHVKPRLKGDEQRTSLLVGHDTLPLSLNVSALTLKSVLQTV